MKILKKAITLNVGLVLMGSAVFAQNLNDAKKAIDAEQYQKAKSMLKTLVGSQASNGENYYNLGLVYLKTGYIDSARATFNAGIAADKKNASNYAGLGEADLISNNPTSAKTNFDQAISIAPKDYKTYLAVGRAYLAQNKPEDVVTKPDYANALANLNKADELDAKDKDADVFVSIGDAYALQSNNSEALGPYFRVADIDPTNRRAKVQTGRMYKQSRAFAEGETELKDVIAADANYGPAYRELGELYLQWSNFGTDKEKAAKAIENYKKYLDLTDKSLESQLRYAQFLFYAKDYPELEKVATALNVQPSDPHAAAVSRMKGYASFENKNYDQAITSLNELFAKQTDKSKLLASDYAYLGKAQLQKGQDSIALISLIEAAKLDSTNADGIAEVAGAFTKAKKYGQAADAYELALKYNPMGKGSLYNYYYLGINRFYQGYFDQKAKKALDVPALVRADTALGTLIKLSPDLAEGVFTRARLNNLIDDKVNPKGLSAPYYEKYVSMIKPEDQDKAKTNLTEAYDALGEFYEKKGDKQKAIEFFTKSVALDPTAQYAPAKLKQLTGAPAAKPKGK
jgi:tetratricopeptide (TPR) repeat protein